MRTYGRRHANAGGDANGGFIANGVGGGVSDWVVGWNGNGGGANGVAGVRRTPAILTRVENACGFSDSHRLARRGTCVAYGACTANTQERRRRNGRKAFADSITEV